MTLPRAKPGASIALVLALGACTANGFDGSVYRCGGVTFRVGPVPSEWRRIEVSDASLAFRDEVHEASVLVNSRCGERDDDAPLAALTSHLLIGTTDREFATEDTIPFDGRESRHSVLRAKLDGVLMAYDVYVIKKDGCVYDLVYVASPDAFAKGAPAFERFALGFHTMDPRALSGGSS